VGRGFSDGDAAAPDVAILRMAHAGVIARHDVAHHKIAGGLPRCCSQEVAHLPRTRRAHSLADWQKGVSSCIVVRILVGIHQLLVREINVVVVGDGSTSRTLWAEGDLISTSERLNSRN
jgi:hypothetical protein